MKPKASPNMAEGRRALLKESLFTLEHDGKCTGSEGSKHVCSVDAESIDLRELRAIYFTGIKMFTDCMDTTT